MRRAPARFFGSALLLAACCHPTPKAALPSDLPPPEYETPRAYDLGGPRKKDAGPAQPAAPAPSATPPAVPAPTTAPAAPPASAAPPPKG